MGIHIFFIFWSGAVPARRNRPDLGFPSGIVRHTFITAPEACSTNVCLPFAGDRLLFYGEMNSAETTRGARQKKGVRGSRGAGEVRASDPVPPGALRALRGFTVCGAGRDFYRFWRSG